jgi:hypothetical protein
VLLEYARVLKSRSGHGDAERADALLAEARRLGEDLALSGLVTRMDALQRPEGMARGPTAVEARFAREGEFWTVAYAGRTLRLTSRGCATSASCSPLPASTFTCSSWSRRRAVSASA